MRPCVNHRTIESRQFAARSREDSSRRICWFARPRSRTQPLMQLCLFDACRVPKRLKLSSRSAPQPSLCAHSITMALNPSDIQMLAENLAKQTGMNLEQALEEVMATSASQPQEVIEVSDTDTPDASASNAASAAQKVKEEPVEKEPPVEGQRELSPTPTCASAAQAMDVSDMPVEPAPPSTASAVHSAPSTPQLSSDTKNKVLSAMATAVPAAGRGKKVTLQSLSDDLTLEQREQLANVESWNQVEPLLRDRLYKRFTRLAESGKLPASAATMWAAAKLGPQCVCIGVGGLSSAFQIDDERSACMQSDHGLSLATRVAHASGIQGQTAAGAARLGSCRSS